MIERNGSNENIIKFDDEDDESERKEAVSSVSIPKLPKPLNSKHSPNDKNTEDDLFIQIKSKRQNNEIINERNNLENDLKEIEFVLKDELEYFKENELDNIVELEKLEKDEIEIMVFKDDNFLIANSNLNEDKISNQEKEINYEDEDNFSYEKNNKIKQLVLLMDYENDSDEEEKIPKRNQQKIIKQDDTINVNVNANINSDSNSSENNRHLDPDEQSKIVMNNNLIVNEHASGSGEIKKKSVKEKSNEIFKDKKIMLNLEEIEKQYVYSDKMILLGDLNPNDDPQMKKVLHDLEMMHPHEIKEGKVVPYPYCVNTGWFCCGNGDCSKSGIEKLGIGMVCYFKVLKVFLICFSIITLFNLPLYYIYSNNHPEVMVSNYRDALFKTTIGNIASSKYYNIYL
jgi:hypothetical protein